MKKTQLIIFGAAGIITFALTFGAGFFLKRNKAAAATADAPATQSSPSAPADSALPFENTNISWSGTETGGDLTMAESQLKTLIFDLRQKMELYQIKQKELDQEAQRIEIARQSLQEEIEQLNLLREKLNVTLSSLQEKDKAIRDSLIKIEAVEKTNFQRIAATYDKMDPAQAGKILATMMSNNQVKDAVRILYYMSERNAGKLLGEIGAVNPSAASVLSLQLKQIQEQP